MKFKEFKQKYQKIEVKEYPNKVLEAVKKPMVSVHVSTYQHADFIRDCLDGVLKQNTDFKFEIIIGEDESDDGTREICKKYADLNRDKIRLFLHKRKNNININGRPTHVFQFSYSHFTARGKYIAICEGDDLWIDPLKLQKQVDFMEENGKYSMCYHPSINRINEESSRFAHRVSSAHEPGNIITWPRTSTIVYRNSIKEFPESFFQTINTDSFLKAILSLRGKKHRVDTLRPSIRNIHIGGIWGMTKLGRRLGEQLNSRLNIYDHVLGTCLESKHRYRLVSTAFENLKLCLPWTDGTPSHWSVTEILAVMRERRLLPALAARISRSIASRLCPF